MAYIVTNCESCASTLFHSFYLQRYDFKQASGPSKEIAQIKYHFKIGGVIISRPPKSGWVLKAVTGQISGLEFNNRHLAAIHVALQDEYFS